MLKESEEPQMSPLLSSKITLKPLFPLTWSTPIHRLTVPTYQSSNSPIYRATVPTYLSSNTPIHRLTVLTYKAPINRPFPFVASYLLMLRRRPMPFFLHSLRTMRPLSKWSVLLCLCSLLLRFRLPQLPLVRRQTLQASPLFLLLSFNSALRQKKMSPRHH